MIFGAELRCPSYGLRFGDDSVVFVLSLSWVRNNWVLTSFEVGSDISPMILAMLGMELRTSTSKC